MAYTADQIEKHTIVLRLAESIYKMQDQQLAMLLEALAQASEIKENQVDSFLAKLPVQANDTLRRQMIIGRIFTVIRSLDAQRLLQCLRVLKGPDYRWVREYPRLSCFLLVDYAADGKAYRSCIRDISADGVFIETAEHFDVSQEIALCFILSEANDSVPFKIQGRVKRIYPDGIGVQYEQITDYQRDILNTLIKKIN
ncbi:MAG: PilZ domain-containing protein [Desulfatitalea sp.]|nr:PilZ domain-containing protein [Desulfatitalea sp.]NNK02335.1 PilZ domain-containing protein [Desulfatitalea sp.]